MSANVKQRAVQAARIFRLLAWLVVLLPVAGATCALCLWWLGSPPDRVDWLLFAVFYLVTLTGIELGFHRHVTHQAFSCQPWLSFVLVATGSMAFQGPVIWWAATHRRHHYCVDAPGDPHSPHWTPAGNAPGRARGFVHSHMGWLFERAHTHPEDWARMAKDLYRNPRLLAFQVHYLVWPAVGLALPALLGGVLRASWHGALMGLLWGGCVRLLAVNHVYWSVNSLCHMARRRAPGSKAGHSRNIVLLAIPTLGQSWHRNHHQQPHAACVGQAWWQLDPGAWMIALWKSAGWVDRVQPMNEAPAGREGERHGVAD